MLFLFCMCQGTHNFGGIRVGNGPTEEDAEIIQHDQLSTHSEEGEEVSTWASSLSGHCRQQDELTGTGFIVSRLFKQQHSQWSVFLAVFSLTVSWSLPGLQKKSSIICVCWEMWLCLSPKCHHLRGAQHSLVPHLLLPCQWKFRGCISAALKICLYIDFDCWG